MVDKIANPAAAAGAYANMAKVGTNAATTENVGRPSFGDVLKTQIQEQSLVYAPKIIAIFAVVFVMFPLFVTTMQTFMNVIADKIVGIG